MSQKERVCYLSLFLTLSLDLFSQFPSFSCFIQLTALEIGAKMEAVSCSSTGPITRCVFIWESEFVFVYWKKKTCLNAEHNVYAQESGKYLMGWFT